MNAVVSVASVSLTVVCDQVDQVVPAHQVDDIDEVHELDPVHQVDHKDESWGETVGRTSFFAWKSSAFVPFVGGNLAFASKSTVFVPFSRLLCWKLYFFAGKSWPLGTLGNSSGDSSEMGEASAPQPLLPHAPEARMTVVLQHSL